MGDLKPSSIHPSFWLQGIKSHVHLVDDEENESRLNTRKYGRRETVCAYAKRKKSVPISWKSSSRFQGYSFRRLVMVSVAIWASISSGRFE